MPPQVRMADMGGAGLADAKEPEPLPVDCPFASCKADANGKAPCLTVAAFGFSEVQAADLGAEAGYRQARGCSYLMAPGNSFAMPEVVTSFKTVLAYQTKHLGYSCGGLDGLQPSHSMSDLCRRAIYRLQARCSDTWKSMLPGGCEEMEPPYGFTGGSTLKELCPVECTKMEDLDVSALAGAFEAREQKRQRELEVARQKELEKQWAARSAQRRQAQAEARRKDASAAEAKAQAGAEMRKARGLWPAALLPLPRLWQPAPPRLRHWQVPQVQHRHSATLTSPRRCRRTRNCSRPWGVSRTWQQPLRPIRR
ncbi:unnamed protein product [Effrenium voratum]|nr:unnamed protein product [Effrenium voratum]